MSTPKQENYTNKKPINENKEISYDEFQKDILIEKITSKDQQIYDLLSKIKTQESKIDFLNREMDEKDKNITTLEEYYKVQIEELKKMLGFKGDLNLLLNKKEGTYEYEFDKMMKFIRKDNINKDAKIENLNNELKLIERDNEQLSIFIEIKKNNKTMLEILKAIEKNKKIKKANIQSKIDEEIMVKNLIKRNKFLRKNLDEIKKSIKKGKYIRDTLPKPLMPNSNYDFINNNNNINNEIKNEEMEKKLEKIKEKETKENEILLNKYLSIVKQNKKEIIKGNEYLNNIDNIYSKEMKKYVEELLQIFKLIQKFIGIYYKSFDKTYSLLLRKEDCDKLLEKEFNNLNRINFPLLFKFIELQKEDDKNTNKERRKSLKKELKISPKNIITNYFNNHDEEHKKMELLNDLNNKENKIDYSIEDIISEKLSLFSSIERKKEQQINNLPKEKLVSYVLTFNTFIKNYENFINKYINSKDVNIYKKYMETPKIKIKNIEQKIIDVNNKRQELIKKQNQINIVMETSSNTINRLKSENLKLNLDIKLILSNDKKNKIPKLNINSNINMRNNSFKKALTNRNSIKDAFNFKNDSYMHLTDRGYIKDKNKIYKLKIK